VGLSEELEQIAERASAYADGAEELVAVIPAEPSPGRRVYLCAFRAGGNGDEASWLALDPDARPVESRSLLREAISIAAMCEVAEETAGGGDLDELLSRLVALRLTENPPGVDEAEEALLALQRVLGAPPRLATPSYLDELGAATKRLEDALGDQPGSPFTEALRTATTAVQQLAEDVETNYKRELR
jgi:hypothetical protein